MIKKIISIHKPEEVDDVKSKIISLNGKNFYIDLTYVVPSSSKYLKKTESNIKITWSEEIKKAIETFLNIDVQLCSADIKKNN